MKTRRQFIQIVPLASVGLLAACGKKPEPTPAAAPVRAAPAPAAAEAAKEAAAAAVSPPPYALAPAPPQPMLDNSDSQALALGYTPSGASADKTKYPQKADDQFCGNCTFYQGAPGSDVGPCPLFPGKRVYAKAWCSGYVRKPA